MKKIFLFFLCLSLCYSFFDFGKYCTCNGPSDCKSALFSCNQIILSKDIDNLEVDGLNGIINCNGHKINNLVLKNVKNGTVENCVFESVDGNNLEIKGKLGILKLINNTFKYCLYGVYIKDLVGKGKIVLLNNTFFVNKYAIYSMSDVNLELKNNTIYKTNVPVLCKNCSSIPNKEEILKNNIVTNKTIFHEETAKKTENKNNGSNWFLICIIFVIILAFVGFVLYKKYKEENEDEFKW